MGGLSRGRRGRRSGRRGQAVRQAAAAGAAHTIARAASGRTTTRGGGGGAAGSSARRPSQPQAASATWPSQAERFRAADPWFRTPAPRALRPAPRAATDPVALNGAAHRPPEHTALLYAPCGARDERTIAQRTARRSTLLSCTHLVVRAMDTPSRSAPTISSGRGSRPAIAAPRGSARGRSGGRRAQARRTAPRWPTGSSCARPRCT